VPPGLFKNMTQLKITPLKFDAASVPDGTLLRFDLDAADLSTNAAVSTFTQNIKLTIDARGLSNASAGSNWFVAYRDPNDEHAWHKLPVVLDDVQGVIQANLGHFSSYIAGSEPGEWHYQWALPTVSTFSGAATYNYSVKIPVGRGGLSPNVDLSYSSRGIDGLVIGNFDDGPIGMGWSISDIEISRDGVYLDRDIPTGQMAMHHRDQFTLAMNGTGNAIFPAPGANPQTDATVRYYVENAPQLFVQRVRIDSTNMYWMVRTAEGTTYRLGYTPDAVIRQTVVRGPLINIDYASGSTITNTSDVIRWRIDTTTDVLGNQIQYDYIGNAAPNDWTYSDSYDPWSPGRPSTLITK
jgi:hypothetical protein